MDRGNKSAGRHGLHLLPYKPSWRIFYSQLFFKPPLQLHWSQVYIPGRSPLRMFFLDV